MAAGFILLACFCLIVGGCFIAGMAESPRPLILSALGIPLLIWLVIAGQQDWKIERVVSVEFTPYVSTTSGSSIG